MVLRHRATNLLGAMWLELAASLVVKHESRDCAHCGQPFELVGPSDPASPGRKKRSDKRYCTDRCSNRAYNATRPRKGQVQDGSPGSA